jgi:hypothetical protein
MKRTPLRRTGRLARTSRLRARGKPRFRSYTPNRVFQHFVRTQGCVAHWVQNEYPLGKGFVSLTIRVSACAGRIEFAHLTSRGAGGKDEGNGVGLCTRHHREQHAIGIRSFEAKYGISLRVHAERLWAHHQQEGR